MEINEISLSDDSVQFSSDIERDKKKYKIRKSKIKKLLQNLINNQLDDTEKTPRIIRYEYGNIGLIIKDEGSSIIIDYYDAAPSLKLDNSDIKYLLREIVNFDDYEELIDRILTTSISIKEDNVIIYERGNKHKIEKEEVYKGLITILSGDDIYYHINEKYYIRRNKDTSLSNCFMCSGECFINIHKVSRYIGFSLCEDCISRFILENFYEDEENGKYELVSDLL
jgi:hypothetical protein